MRIPFVRTAATLVSFAALAATATAGCSSSGGSDGGGGGGGMKSFAKDVYPIITSSAAGCTVCHAMGAGATGGNLDLSGDAATVYGRLVGKDPATNLAPGCTTIPPGVKLVVPNDPTKSLLYSKLLAMPLCGQPMPLGGNPPGLPMAELTTIMEWIDEGAPM
ncbi:MAG: hypothetical protein JOZ69_05425 [Myxococcales bacterium]|nr:hypothetical protein [Myxococcales bacterium]